MSASLLEKICSADNLPSLPAAAIEVLQLTRAEDVEPEDIARVIQKDPALTAKILKVANSPMFGLSCEIGSVSRAIMLLGLRTVKVMALSFSLVDKFGEHRKGEFDYPKYWRRSLTHAVASKLIGGHLHQVRRDECFVGGLLADVGMLAACRCVPEKYREVLARQASAPGPIQAIEQEMLGLTHAQISAALLRKWSLPALLCDAVAAHHGEGIDELGDRTRLLASVLYAGALIADLFCGDVQRSELDPVKARCGELVSLPAGALECVLDEVAPHVTEASSLFNLEIGESISYEDLRTGAMMQLAALSITAEMERAQASSRAEQAQQELERVNERAAIDALTQIANRRAFDEALEEAIQNSHARHAPLALIMADVDHFKQFNDTYGHQAGDEVLRQVAGCIRDVVRNRGFVARYGGEEFAVIGSGLTPSAVQVVAEQIRGAIEARIFMHQGTALRVTVSLGAAVVDAGPVSLSNGQMIEAADRQLYAAKRNGRNRVAITREVAGALCATPASA